MRGGISDDAETFVDHVQAAEDVISSASSSPQLAIWARIGLGYLAILQNDADLAKIQYAEINIASGKLLNFVSSDRILGLLAQTHQIEIGRRAQGLQFFLRH